MKTFHNPHHALHQGREEMFRGRMVHCHEVPARLDYVLATPGTAARASSSAVQREFGTSDHAPVVAVLE